MSVHLPTPPILVIEDDDPISQILKFMLERQGWRTLIATDGRTARKMVEGGQERPGLILLDDVRRLLAHPDWHVRVQASKALGRIGDRSDIVRLQGMLGDPQWWVRYRAAQALLALPFMRAGDVETLVASTADRFAADMLRHVLSEREAG